jgi:hypothetical protein
MAEKKGKINNILFYVEMDSIGGIVKLKAG